MSDDALKSILDREGVSASVGKHFSEPLSLLGELVDYGTNLIARAFGSSPRDFKATILLLSHLQQFVSHLDASAELLHKGCCLSTNLQIRSLLESLLTLKWILAKDTDSKIEHILVANLRRRKKWQSIALPGSAEAAKNPDAASRLSVTPEQIKELTKEIAQIDSLLAESKRSAINATFEQSYLKRKRDPHWYELCGAKSIRDIAALVDRQKDYDYIYGPFSSVTHGGDFWKSVMFHKDKVEINSIREAEDVPMLCRMASTYALEFYRLILSEYRFAELENFDRKYLEQWRDRFHKTFNIDVKTELKVI